MNGHIKEAMECTGLTPMERLVLLRFAMQVDAGSSEGLRVRTLADLCECGLGAIQRAVARLESKGALVRLAAARSGRPVSYRVVTDQSQWRAP